MFGTFLSPLALGFAGLRLLLAVAIGVGAWALFKNPRPRAALALVLGVNLVAALAMFVPLQRPYALGEGSDRSFNLGMAAAVTNGVSPFEHTQVGFGSPEPLWNLAVAALAGFRTERVATAYAALTPLAILAMGLLLYRALRQDESQADAWERVLIVFAVFGLASLSMSARPPVLAFFVGNFLQKPQHGIGLALAAFALGMRVRGARPLPLGLVLGLLAWVFLLDWGYLLPILFLETLRRPRAERNWRGLLTALLVSAVIAAPYVLHLLRDYNPLSNERAAQHMWEDAQGLLLAVPNWSTLDLGPLLTLGIAGFLVQRKSAHPRALALTSLALGAWLLWLLSIPAALAGFSPEPDEMHFFLRFATAASAGAALAAGARFVETACGWRTGQAHALALAACFPFCFAAYWDPPSMDRYYPMSRVPIRPKVRDYTDWIRANTSKRAIFVGGRTSASFIPALSGRQVLLNEGGRLVPKDLAARKQVERVLLTSEDADAVRAAARRYGVTHIAIDEALEQEYGAQSFDDLARSAACRTLLSSSAVKLLEVK